MDDFREAVWDSKHLHEPNELDDEPADGDHGSCQRFSASRRDVQLQAGFLVARQRFQALQYVLYARHVLTEVETRMRELRRSYRPVLVETSQPRGRILLRQSLVHLARVSLPFCVKWMSLN